DEVAGRSGGSGGGRAGEVCGGNAGASGRELMAPAVAAVEAGAVWPPVAFETATAPFDHVAFFRDMKLNRHGFWTSPTCKESTDVTRDEAEGSSNAAEGSKGEEKDDMCKKPVEATGGA
ncbi:unnamed protein product, partial [Ascophyllum nodosum]